MVKILHGKGLSDGIVLDAVMSRRAISHRLFRRLDRPVYNRKFGVLHPSTITRTIDLAERKRRQRRKKRRERR